MAQCVAYRILCFMALSTGRNEICSSVVQRHFQPGMEDLVSFAHSLIEAQRDLSVFHQMRGHIARASQEMNRALKELEGGQRTIDAKSVQLVVQKKLLEEERQVQAQQLSNLRHQLDSRRSQERRSREMQGTAQRHLQEMQWRLFQKKQEVVFNEQMRDVGFGLMFIPIVGTIAGGILAGVSHMALMSAQEEKRNAEDEVNRHSADVKRHSAETDRLQDLIREAEANIWSSERRLSSIQTEKQQLASQQAEVVTFQNTLRKCVNFLALLAGKVDTAEFLSRDIVIYAELEGVLEDILKHVFPLMGQRKKTCVMALSTSEIRALIQRLKSAREKLRLEGPRQGWRNVAIDF